MPNIKGKVSILLLILSTEDLNDFVTNILHQFRHEWKYIKRFLVESRNLRGNLQSCMPSKHCPYTFNITFKIDSTWTIYSKVIFNLLSWILDYNSSPNHSISALEIIYDMNTMLCLHGITRERILLQSENNKIRLCVLHAKL